MRLLTVLREADRALDTSTLADRVGLHPTTVRAHLEQLVEAGFVVANPENRTTPGRPRLLYEADQDAHPVAQPQGYRLLAEMLAGHLRATADDPAGQAIETGEAWGCYLVDQPPPYSRHTAKEGRAELMELHERLGFDPEVEDAGTRMIMRRCPFLEVARDHQEVVCSLHLGLMRGALKEVRAPLATESLVPFAEPDGCVARLSDLEEPV